MKGLSQFVLVFLGCLPLFSSGQDSGIQGRISALAAQTQSRFAPDKRVAIFNVTVDADDSTKVTIETTEKEALSYFKSLLVKEMPALEIKESLLPAAGLSGKVYGIANLSVANNRLRPTHPSELVSQTLLGTPLEVLKRDEGYYLARTPDGYISWLEEAAVTTMDTAAFQKWKAAEKIVFIADYGHAYSAPSDKAERVSDLVAGNILQVLEKGKTYLRVLFPDNRTGYVQARLTQDYGKWLSRAQPSPEQIITTAKTLLGVPYLWGGTSVKGVDCSGFTKTSFFLNGIILARDASQQALNGEDVDIHENDSVSIAKCLRNLKMGDLLFFGRKAQGEQKERVIHTAIYLGNGEFIQSAGMVRINSLVNSAANFDKHQTKTLLRARRVLTAVGSPGIRRIESHPLYSINKN